MHEEVCDASCVHEPRSCDVDYPIHRNLCNPRLFSRCQLRFYLAVPRQYLTSHCIMQRIFNTNWWHSSASLHSN